MYMYNYVFVYNISIYIFYILQSTQIEKLEKKKLGTL